MPAPMRSWGGIVHAQLDRGRSARAASPPETSTTPDAIRMTGAPARGASRAASIAASGITVTTRPAAAGDIPQPSTSRSTTRKRAATSPPERRNRAAFAERCGRSAGSGTRCASRPRTARSVASATGTCARKIDSQPKSSVRAPPIAGPRAAPATPAVTQMRAARASSPRHLREEVERGGDEERGAGGLDAAGARRAPRTTARARMRATLRRTRRLRRRRPCAGDVARRTPRGRRAARRRG